MQADLPLGEESRQEIGQRLVLLRQRYEALQEKSLGKVLRLYRADGGDYLRRASLLCDIWLSIFGKREGNTG